MWHLTWLASYLRFDIDCSAIERRRSSVHVALEPDSRCGRLERQVAAQVQLPVAAQSHLQAVPRSQYQLRDPKQTKRVYFTSSSAPLAGFPLPIPPRPRPWPLLWP